MSARLNHIFNRTIYLTVFGLLFAAKAFSLDQPRISYTPLANTTLIDTRTLLDKKKQKYKSYRKSDKKYYDYLMFEYYHHYRMIDESLKANYFIRDSKLNAYLEDLVNEIVMRNKQRVRRSNPYAVLIVQTEDINAYALGDGILAVTTGLISSLGERSELASVLCHELAHDVLDHNEKSMTRNAFLYTSEEIKDSIEFVLEDKNYSINRMEEYLAGIYAVSMKKNRKNELEADSLGLIFLKNTGFSGASAANALHKIDEPHNNRKSISVFDYLRNNKVPVKDIWFYKKEASRLDDLVNNEKDVFFMDTIHSHPETTERINILNRMTGNEPIIPEPSEKGDIITFNELQLNCLVQTILTEYRNDDPAKAIYYAMILKDGFPEQTFSDNIIVISLCKGAFLKEYLRLTLNIGSTDSVNSPAHNEIIYLMQKIKQNEFKELICKLRETAQGLSGTDLYASTANLFSGYFCYNDIKYNYVMRNYLKLYKKSFFKFDLIYLPKKKTRQK